MNLQCGENTAIKAIILSLQYSREWQEYTWTACPLICHQQNKNAGAQTGYCTCVARADKADACHIRMGISIGDVLAC
jgi:hypothetical protein